MKSATDEALRIHVQTARSAGDSWTVIGAVLGMTAERAAQRFGGLESTATSTAASG